MDEQATPALPDEKQEKTNASASAENISQERAAEPAESAEPTPPAETPPVEAQPQPAAAAAEDSASAKATADGTADKLAEASQPAAEGQPAEPKNYVLARYSALGTLGLFEHKLAAIRCRLEVIVRTERGLELAEVVCKAEPGMKYQDEPVAVAGEVLREATADDLSDIRHLKDEARREFEFCKKEIASRDLDMRLVEVEHIFGGDRIIFYFVAEQRVDFRALVRDIAREFRTRVEMRQIGVRDEARLMGDFERCGRPLCCRTWLKNLEPVSIKMAKSQKPTLDPTKISGRCGRLMCCLRFEDSTYEELRENLPEKGTLVETKQGIGEVVDFDVLTQIVSVNLPNNVRVNVPVESLVRKNVPAEEARKKAEE